MESTQMLAAILGIVLSLQLGSVHADPVPVRYAEGVTHGFLVLRTLQGKDVADGDLSQVVHGDRVSRRLVFHFKDGSIQDESVVFSQRGTFRLLSDHLIQKGPAFPHPIGEAPSFVKAEAPLFLGGPVLRIELTSPSWP
jgi:hypothetical protein